MMCPLPDDQRAVGGGTCGMDANDNPVCCSELAAGYKKATYDAGDVRFGQVWVDPATKRMTWFAWAGAAYLQTTVRDLFYDPVRQDLLMYGNDFDINLFYCILFFRDAADLQRTCPRVRALCWVTRWMGRA